jgi:hypothetical protein
MEEDEEFDDFGNELAIANILYVIEKKKQLDETDKFRIDCIGKYIQRINNTLDSLVPKGGKSYIFTSHFIEVVQALANKPKEKISIDDLVNYKQEFSLIGNKLENLKTTPQEFYNSADSEYIFKFMKKIEPIFQGKPHPILGYDPCGYD